MPSESSLYDLLGVAPDSNPKQIKAAYHAAIKTTHPDVDRRPGAHDLTLELIDAYRVLGDPERRRMYNARLMLATPKPTVPEAPRFSPESRVAELAVQPATVETAVQPPPSAGTWQGRAPTAFARQWLHGLPSWMTHAAVAAGIFSVGFVFFIAIIVSAKSLAERGTAAMGAPAVAALAASTLAQPTRSPCTDAASGLKGEALYRECVRTRVSLHQRMVDANSAAAREEYELQDALAEIRQAAGAAQIKMVSTTQFIQESVWTLDQVRRSTKDQQTRRIAENYYYYYNCHALKHCTP